MRVYKLLTLVFLKIHNFSYRWASVFAKRAEGGLHPKHRLMDYHRFFLENIKEGEKVLDVGCGNGALSFDLAKKASKVVGIDLNPKNIEDAKRHYSAHNIEYIAGDITKRSLKDERFDVAVLSNVLEHISERVEFLKKIKSVAPRILIRVPMVNRDWLTLYKKELGVEYRLDRTHFIEYTLENFKEEIERAGLKIEKYSVQFGEIWAVVK